MGRHCVHSLLGTSCATTQDDEVPSLVRSALHSSTSSVHRACLVASFRKWERGGCSPCGVVATKRRKSVPPPVRRSHADRFEDAPVPLTADGIPVHVYNPLVESYYDWLHGQDPRRYPLSPTSFSSRTHMYEHGLAKVHDGDTSTWKRERIRSVFVHRGENGDAKVSAIVVNESYQPRWGRLFCTSTSSTASDLEWQQDLEARPHPVFVKKLKSAHVTYCGEWSFARANRIPSDASFAYVYGDRPRNGVYVVTCVGYDSRWDQCA